MFDRKAHLDACRDAAHAANKLFHSLDEEGKKRYKEEKARKARENAASYYSRNKEMCLRKMKEKYAAKKAIEAAKAEEA